MTDYLSIGSTPAEEECLDAGHPLELVECQIFARQLKREFPFAQLRVKQFPHDFGAYREVVVLFDDNDTQAIDVAYDVEANARGTWDGEARRELSAAGIVR